MCQKCVTLGGVIEFHFLAHVFYHIAPTHCISRTWIKTPFFLGHLFCKSCVHKILLRSTALLVDPILSETGFLTGWKIINCIYGKKYQGILWTIELFILRYTNSQIYEFSIDKKIDKSILSLFVRLLRKVQKKKATLIFANKKHFGKNVVVIQ